jgi:hypothetical protein
MNEGESRSRRRLCGWGSRQGGWALISSCATSIFTLPFFSLPWHSLLFIVLRSPFEYKGATYFTYMLIIFLVSNILKDQNMLSCNDTQTLSHNTFFFWVLWSSLANASITPQRKHGKQLHVQLSIFFFLYLAGSKASLQQTKYHSEHFRPTPSERQL